MGRSCGGGIKSRRQGLWRAGDLRNETRGARLHVVLLEREAEVDFVVRRQASDS